MSYLHSSVFLLYFVFISFCVVAKEDYLSDVRKGYRALGNDSLSYIIKKNPELVLEEVRDGRTLLGSTVMVGDLSAIRFLLESGANPNFGKPRPIELALSRMSSGLGFVGKADGSRILTEVEMLGIINMLLNYGAKVDFAPEFGSKEQPTFFESMIGFLCLNGNFEENFSSIIGGMNIEISRSELGQFYQYVGSSLGEDVHQYSESCFHIFESKVINH